MASTAFGLSAAPTPVSPLTNPTGSTTSSGAGGTNANFPFYGPVVGPSANTGPWGANSGVANLSSGLDIAPNQTSAFYRQSGKAFGSGYGSILDYIFQGGLYNPQIADAFLDAQQPGISRGESSIESAFGAEGSRFSSEAALGIGDYQSQVQLNQQQTLASLFENAQSQEVGLLGQVLPTIHAEQANKSGFLDDLIGGLETAGGIASAFIPGAQGLAGPLIAGGLGTVAAGNSPSGSGGGGQLTQAQLAAAITAAQKGGTSTSGVPNFPTQNTPGPPIGLPTTQTSPIIQNISGGAALGGSDPFGTNSNDNSGNDTDQSFYNDMFLF